MEKLAEKSLIGGPEITWPKDFHELKIIDDVLRCGICYDYIKTCMVTPCAHSYCSICIRRSLLYKTACPTCFEEVFETGLRNNRVLDRVTELFVNIKDKLIKHLRIAAVHFNCNEQLQSPVPCQNLMPQKTTIRNETPKRNIKKPSRGSSIKGKLNFMYAPKTNSNSQKPSDISKQLEDILGSPVANEPTNSELDCLVSAIETEYSNISKVPPMFLQPKVETQSKFVEVTTVACPVCGVDIPERNINAHLDSCLANVDKAPVKSPVKHKQKRNPVPKMVWSLMAEKDLRKKLKEYGLNTQGDKKALISRIQRYIVLFNSECDADNPRPIFEIIRQVEREEKQAPVLNQQRLVINKKSDPKIIEEENKKYLQDNKDSFKKLIEIMKEREGRLIKPLARQSNRISSDDEYDVSNKIDEVSSLTMHSNDETPSTSKFVRESINLCDYNEDRSISPILGEKLEPKDKISYQLYNGYTSESSEDVLLSPNARISQSSKITYKLNNYHHDNLEQVSTLRKSRDEELNDNCMPNSPETSSPLPGCIITSHTSDSDESISILDQHIDEDFLDNATGLMNSGPDNNSQLIDPDFVVDTEQFENENYSEEVFVPVRKSKRKLQNSVLADSNKNVIPRRMRRRINK